jgi:mannose-1-phosphate guanylyltransferase
MKRDDAYAVIMAGGRGERFWPLSRVSHPKQLLRLLGNLTLIEQTVERLLPLFDPSRIVIITNGDYVAPMQSLLASIPDENIIGEPVGRDTAPCIALATAYVKAIAKQPDPVLAFLPSDHVINDVESFRGLIADSLEVATKGRLVAVGIKPAYPSSGYGYVKLGAKLPFSYGTAFRESLGFKEKPSASVAAEYMASGDYKWNGGIFVMSASTAAKEFAAHAPELHKVSLALDSACKLQDKAARTSAIAAVYSGVQRISIDYAVMEKSSNIVVAEASFDWDDVGSWTALRNQIRPEKDNNVVRGLHIGMNSRNCIVVGGATHLVATVDVEDLIIVNTEDATLVCNLKSAQSIKELVQLIASKPELSSFL